MHPFSTVLGIEKMSLFFFLRIKVLKTMGIFAPPPMNLKKNLPPAARVRSRVSAETVRPFAPASGSLKTNL